MAKRGHARRKRRCKGIGIRCVGSRLVYGTWEARCGKKRRCKHGVVKSGRRKGLCRK